MVVQVQSLAWHNELGILCCWSCGVGLQLQLIFDPWPGNFHMLGMQQKKKKKKEAQSKRLYCFFSSVKPDTWKDDDILLQLLFFEPDGIEWKPADMNAFV